MNPDNGNFGGFDTAATEEMSVLFDVLRQHKDKNVSKPAHEGTLALKNGDAGRATNAVHAINGALESYEIHPALAHQLKMANTAIAELPEAGAALDGPQAQQATPSPSF